MTDSRSKRNDILRDNGEEFEYYVARALEEIYNKIFFLSDILTIKIDEINERLHKMATLAEELGMEETTLSEVIPALALEIGNLNTNLNNEINVRKEKESTLTGDTEELAKNQAEIAAITKVKENLTPLVEKAKGLVPATPAPIPTPEGGTTPPPAETPPAPVQEPTPTPAPEHAPETPVNPTPETPAA